MCEGEAGVGEGVANMNKAVSTNFIILCSRKKETKNRKETLKEMKQKIR